MADQQNLKDAMIELLREEFANRPAIVCKVVSVNGTKVKVRAVTDEKVYQDVRLQAHPGNGILIIPSVGSFIILQWLSDTAGFVAMVILFMVISIPLIEKKQLAKRPDYADYVKRVSKIIPWFPKN